MNDNRRRILEMLSEGKISSDEADRLLTMVDNPTKDASKESSNGESIEELGEHIGGLGERIGDGMRIRLESLENMLVVVVVLIPILIVVIFKP